MGPKFIRETNKSSFIVVDKQSKIQFYIKIFVTVILFALMIFVILKAMPSDKVADNVGRAAASESPAFETRTSNDSERYSAGVEPLHGTEDQPAAERGVTYDGTSSERQRFVDDYVEKEMEKADAFCARNPDFESCW